MEENQERIIKIRFLFFYNHPKSPAFRIHYRILTIGFEHTLPSFHIFIVCLNP